MAITVNVSDTTNKHERKLLKFIKRSTSTTNTSLILKTIKSCEICSSD